MIATILQAQPLFGSVIWVGGGSIGVILIIIVVVLLLRR